MSRNVSSIINYANTIIISQKGNSYLFKIHNVICNVRYYEYNNERDRELFNKYIGKTINIIAKIMNKNTFNFSLVIKIVNIDKPKSGLVKDITLDADFINSGYTMIPYDKSQEREIVVYRREENIKVLVHELIHAFEFEYFILNHDEVDILNTFIHDKYKVEDPHSFEGICDALTVIILDKLNIPKFSYDKALKHIWDKIGQIIYFSGNKNWPPINTFMQTTHGFEYYILKPVILDLLNKSIRKLTAKDIINHLESESIKQRIQNKLSSSIYILDDPKNKDLNISMKMVELEYHEDN